MVNQPVDQARFARFESPVKKKAKTAVPENKGSGIAGVKMDDDYHEKTSKHLKETHAISMGKAIEQCKDIKQPEGNMPWVILDMGSADGLNSIPLFHGCIEQLRQRDDRAIQLVFEDCPHNDFSRIMKLDENTFGPNTFPVSTNRGFFGVTCPPGTVSLSYTSHSMHYLSGPPPVNLKTCGLKDTDASGEERAIFAKQAEKDWEKLLLARATELAPGGRSVISNLGINEKGWYYSSTDRGKSLYTELSASLRSMMADGLITALEFEWATSPEYYRTLEEHKAPFEDPNSPVRKAGLVLKEAIFHRTECPHRQEWLDGTVESATAYGKEFANVVTAFSRNKCMRAFKHPGNTRTPAEQDKLINEVYERFGARVAAAPASFAIDNICLVMVIEKQ